MTPKLLREYKLDYTLWQFNYLHGVYQSERGHLDKLLDDPKGIMVGSQEDCDIFIPNWKLVSPQQGVVFIDNDDLTYEDTSNYGTKVMYYDQFSGSTEKGMIVTLVPGNSKIATATTTLGIGRDRSQALMLMNIRNQRPFFCDYNLEIVLNRRV